jgi:hypothetical protein
MATHGCRIAVASVAFMLVARLAMATLMMRNVLRVPDLVRDVWLVPFKDLFMTGIWFASLFGNQVQWAGRRLEILANGTIREVDG